jgi:hypothetical protein
MENAVVGRDNYRSRKNDGNQFEYILVARSGR